MTSEGPGRRAALPTRLRLVLPLVTPLAAVLLTLLFAPRPVNLPRRVEALQARFAAILARSDATALDALQGSPERAADAAAGGPLGGRLEGVGVLDADLHYLDWSGRPPEPPPDLAEPGSAVWRIERQGARTRLLVRAGPDEAGRLALAAFVLDSRPGDFRSSGLFPPALLRGLDLAVDLAPGEMVDGTAFDLDAPDGTTMMTASARPVDRAHLRSRTRSAAAAWGALALILAGALALDGPRLVVSRRGLALTLAAIAGARLLLVVVRAPAVLLTRELGSAGVYGSSAWFGCLASPADLLLTGLALLLAAMAVAHHLRVATATAPTARVGVALGVAGLLTVCVVGLSGSLTRNASVSLADAPGFWRWGGTTALTAALALALLAAALCWGTAWSIARRGGRGPAMPIALAYLSLALLVAVLLENGGQRLAIERLRSELAPQVLEQSARRSLALSATLRDVAQAFGDDESMAELAAIPERYLAYHFWVDSELFHGGYASSLDFYHPSGVLLSHFGFDLPMLDDDLGPDVDGSGGVRFRRESFRPRAAIEQWLLHAEIPVVRNGEWLGTVVGHVLDEPDNLSFLPRAQPYLSALGPGAPRSSDFPGGPQYVRYDARGTVLVSTLERPPSEAAALSALRNAGGGDEVTLTAGTAEFVGLALREDDALHLLLLRRRGVPETLAVAVRLGLLGPLALGLFAMVAALTRGAGPRRLVEAVRGSFYRKLLAALLLASVVPLVGLGLVLRGYINRRADAAFADRAIRYANIAQQHIEDYIAGPPDQSGAPPEITDDFLYWLRSVIGQEIHAYRDGRLLASSKPELFDSGLVPPRLPGAAYRAVTRDGLPYLVRPARLGPADFPVAYAPVQSDDATGDVVVAVPLVLAQQQIRDAVDRVLEVILLVTVLLVGLLAVVAAAVARTVARPVRELVGATAAIAGGDYAMRLEPRTHDEVAELVRGFNGMAGSLATQRADLERQRDYVEALLRHATTGVLSTDPDGRLVTFNPAARRLLSEAGPALRAGDDLAQALERVEALRPLARALRAPARGPGRPAEVDFERDGRPVRIRVVRVELPGSAGEPVGTLLLLDDVTDLMRSNQLAAWAEMARAIAHEIKNPLTPIQLSAEHLRRLLVDRGVLPAPDVEACIDTVIKQVRTLYEISGEFSAYARLPQLRPAPTDPVEFMRETLSPYRFATPPGVTLDERYAPAPRVSVDRRVLARAVINLVENALQALPDGGTLTAAVDGDGDDVVLTIADDGVGLDDEARRRLFEPYFSTKSSGTGLGLAIVQRAVDAHRGRIEVDSVRGRGTTFRIRLPASDAGSAP